jgi:hypothetical protein
LNVVVNDPYDGPQRGRPVEQLRVQRPKTLQAHVLDERYSSQPADRAERKTDASPGKASSHLAHQWSSGSVKKSWMTSTRTENMRASRRGMLSRNLIEGQPPTT